MKRPANKRRSAAEESPAKPVRQAAATNSAWSWYAAVGALIVIALAAYSNSYRGAFVYDEISEIANNGAIRSLWPPTTAMWEGGELPHRPLPYYSFALNYAISGFEVWSYHALNLAIHLAAGLTLFGLIRRTLAAPKLGFSADAAIGLAWAAAAIWLAHPLQTQAVTYVYQRMESWMALFYLLTLYAFARSMTAEKPSGWLLASTFFCALGMGCKEVMVTAPLLALWYDRTFWSESFAAAILKRKVYYASLAATWLVLFAVVFAQRSTYGELNTPRWTTLEYALSQPAVILRYVTLFFWPSGQCLDYWLIPQINLTQQVPLIALLVLLAAYVLYGAWRGWASSFLIGSFFLILGPTSSILAVADVCVEHRVYLPSTLLAIGVVLLCYFGLRAISDQWPKWLGLVAASAAVMLLISLTLARNEVYADRLTMWSDVVAKAPQNPRAHLNVGQALHDAGEDGLAGRYYTEAIRLDPKYAAAYVNRGNLLLELGLSEAALADYDQAIANASSKADAYNGRAVALRRLGRNEESLAAYDQAIKLSPGNRSVYRNRALLLAELGQTAQAAADAATYAALGGELDPDFIAQLETHQVAIPPQ
ncbi:tetratricopeptide repeat protein [Blastopirellula marina]|uniref:Uncharacterized protein n=1 Tax=Blastopirellula marina TaxID=124 RepID=A0A2S8F3A7_9BACT|nr:tetratricopeptide repeat protein [Blastopirellula marina]PQO26645.1 hypothetical protein C5Y98_30155 [Blastopirellula marina]PTL40956.1 tetratricopeptide repeat protein [Blastopirellula marina]